MDMNGDNPELRSIPTEEPGRIDQRFRAAAVLAGGASLRMGGRDKQFLDAGGEPLAYRLLRRLGTVFTELAVVTNRPEEYLRYPGKVAAFPDRVGGYGPLSGLHAALSESSSPWVYVVACDTPEFDSRWVRMLSDEILREESAGRAPLAAAAAFGAHIEPFHAFYSRNLLPHIETCFERRNFRERYCSIASVLKGRPFLRLPEVRVRTLFPDWRLFRNINTPGDWESYKVRGSGMSDPFTTEDEA